MGIEQQMYFILFFAKELNLTTFFKHFGSYELEIENGKINGEMKMVIKDKRLPDTKEKWQEMKGKWMGWMKNIKDVNEIARNEN